MSVRLQTFRAQFFLTSIAAAGDDELLAHLDMLLHILMKLLPAILASNSRIAILDTNLLDFDITLAEIVGDQQAATYV